ncbi:MULTISPECIES: thermonuclease family protein [unclassified Methylophilus]|uniref:thermonuclease family protein n=1 Tax=unclassified Methylophilus TaxID=2630143 RepID=UPI00037EAF36|nr:MULTISPECIES: thermonuclease family protein [unclassified Methylophilus]
MIKVWLPVGLLIASVYSHAAPVLVNVIDGDTVIIRDNTLTYHLRLLDIDAPERQQAFGIQSRRSLKQLCEHANIAVQLQGRDLYGRTLGHLYCNNTDASQSQIALGMAWFNARYSKRLELDTLQRQAQQQGLGLWQDAEPMPPWQWRKLYGQYYRRQE